MMTISIERMTIDPPIDYLNWSEQKSIEKKSLLLTVKDKSNSDLITIILLFATAV